MSHVLTPREYRIVLRRLGTSEATFGPQFTAIVTATDADGALAEAEKLLEVLGGKFRVVQIRQSQLAGPA